MVVLARTGQWRNMTLLKVVKKMYEGLKGMMLFV
jgi:hypothetical protein